MSVLIGKGRAGGMNHHPDRQHGHQAFVYRQDGGWVTPVRWNLIPNPTAWANLDGWATTGAPVTTFARTPQGQLPHFADHFLLYKTGFRVVITSAGQSNNGVFHTFQAVEGRTYHATANVYLKSLSSAGAVGIQARLVGAGGIPGAVSAPLTELESWTRLTFEFTATATATHELRARLTASGSAEFFFHSAFVFELP